MTELSYRILCDFIANNIIVELIPRIIKLLEFPENRAAHVMHVSPDFRGGAVVNEMKRLGIVKRTNMRVLITILNGCCNDYSEIVKLINIYEGRKRDPVVLCESFGKLLKGISKYVIVNKIEGVFRKFGLIHPIYLNIINAEKKSRRGRKFLEILWEQNCIKARDPITIVDEIVVSAFRKKKKVEYMVGIFIDKFGGNSV